MAGKAAEELDAKLEWIENAANFVLRLTLTGFKKEHFRVQVDGAGRLTVRGQRPADGKCVHKVFQLPSAADLDGISGRFDAGVLTLTVPKRHPAGAAAAGPATIEEIKKKPDAKEEADVKRKEEARVEEAARKAQQETEEAEKKRKQEMRKPAPMAAVAAAEKAKATAAPAEKQTKPEAAAGEKAKAAAASIEKKQGKPEPSGAAAASTEKKQTKPEPAGAAAASTEKKPELAGAAAASTEKQPTAGEKGVDRESLAEKVRRRGEEAEKAAREKKASSSKGGGGWRETKLEDMKWAEGVVDAVKKNKEVVAAAVAAFSLGVLVSHKLFCRK